MIRPVLLAALLGVSGMFAQEKITAKVADPSQPVTLKVSLVSGSIQVSTHAGTEVIVEGQGPQRRRTSEAPEGMRRIAVGSASFNVEEEGNTIRIGSGGTPNRVDLTILVPRRTSVSAQTVNGGTIRIEGVDGDVEASNTNGGVEIRGVNGSVIANTVNGKVEAVIDRVDAAKPMAFTTMNGSVDVTLPANVKANFRMRSENGDVFSDFEMTLRPGNNVEVETRDKGKRWRSSSSMMGSVNGGGPEIRFETLNGRIMIRKGGAK